MSAPTRALTARDQRHDLALAGVVFVGGIISAALSSLSQVYGEEQAELWHALVYVFIISAPLAVRRRWPAPVAIFVSIAYFSAASLRVPELYAGSIAMFITLYTVGAWMTNRLAAMIVRVAITIGMFVWLFIIMYQEIINAADSEDVIAGAFSPMVAYMMLQVLLNLLYFGGAYYFGERAWTSTQQRTALEQRTADLEREREVTAAQAVALDRVRIARELHDVVAHHVSVMGVQAGAARMVIDNDSTQAKQILGSVEDSAREAISELRNLLETLRAPGGDGEDTASTLTLADIEQLAQASTDAGLPTTYTIVGNPTPVPSVIAVNLYRIAQESLTNARRHAGADATADVRIRYDASTIELEVVNTGRIALAPRPGLGQLGMRERTLASGGTIESGPRDRGGWRVRVQVPVASTTETEVSA